MLKTCFKNTTTYLLCLWKHDLRFVVCLNDCLWSFRNTTCFIWYTQARNHLSTRILGKYPWKTILLVVCLFCVVVSSCSCQCMRCAPFLPFTTTQPAAPMGALLLLLLCHEGSQLLWLAFTWHCDKCWLCLKVDGQAREISTWILSERCACVDCRWSHSFIQREIPLTPSSVTSSDNGKETTRIVFVWSYYDGGTVTHSK